MHLYICSNCLLFFKALLMGLEKFVFFIVLVEASRSKQIRRGGSAGLLSR